MIMLCPDKSCTGCGSCLNVCPRNCISMEENHEGFLYPVINTASCIECGLCEKSCPELNPVKKNEKPKVYASWSLNEEVRTTSSSGGLFFTLAEHVIQRGGAVFGVVFNNDMSASHVCAESISELKAIQGSKYIQSNVNTAYKDALKILKEGREVMFTGTPCQIAGMKAFLGKRSYANLTLVDIVCHGTPPAKTLRWYLKAIKHKIGEFNENSFQFRNLNAWGVTPSIEVSEGRRLMAANENLFMQLFLKSLLHRNSCYSCNYTIENRVSDITLADFWGIGRTIPFPHDTSKGCSLVLVNSEHGKDLLTQVSGNILLQERTIEEAKVVNHQLYMSSHRPPQRDEIFNYIYTHTYDEVDRKFINTPYLKFRHFIGDILRTLKLR